MKNLKIMLIFMVLILGIGIGCYKPKAKNIIISSNWSEEKTESFLKKHKQDDVFMVVKGKRINKKGDGIDINGFYINYGKGKKNVKYTTVFHYAKGTRYWDDWDNRADLKGHISNKKALKKYYKLYR